MIFPTPRAIALAALGLPLALFPALLNPGLFGLWLSYALLFLLAFGLDAALCLPPSRMQVLVEAPGELAVGTAGALTVRLTSPRAVARAEVLFDLHPDFEPAKAAFLTLKAGLAAKGLVPLRANRRGELTVDAVWCRYSGPFGLAGRRLHLPLRRKVAVVPDLRPVRAAAFRYFGSRELSAGVQVERFLGDGSEFDALKEWVPGLDPRAISWKASARHQELLCQQFRAERNHQVVLALDTGHLMAEPLEGLPRLDHAVSSALLLGYVALKLGDRVGLFGFDKVSRAFAEPQGGLSSFPRLKALSAKLAYSSEETNFTLGLSELSSRLRRRSLVLVFTEFTDTVTAELMLENLERLSRRQLVVFVALRDTSLDTLALAPPRRLGGLYRAVTAADFLRERELVLKRLRRMGVSCVDAAPGELSARLVNRYLYIKRRELIA